MTWRTLMVIVPRTDVTVKEGDTNHAITASIKPAGVADAIAAAHNFGDLVREWSAGNAAARVDVVVADDTVREVSNLGDLGWWVSPSDARQMIERVAPKGSYDNVMFVWRDDNGAGDKVPTRAGGLTAVGRPGAVVGAGYTVVTTGDNDLGFAGRYPGEILVHEFLHQVENYAKASGVRIPSLHANADYGHPTPTDGSWRSWYEGYMQGTLVGKDGKTAGLTRDGWAKIAAKFANGKGPRGAAQRRTSEHVVR
jgi:hypothetical protein